MRYLVPIALLASTIFTPLYGQFEQGKKVLDAYFDFSTNHQPATNNIAGYANHSLNVSPSLGFLVSDNLEAGAQVGYSIVLEKGSYPSPSTTMYDNKITTFSVGFYARRYFNISEKFLFSTNGGADYFGTGQTTKTTNTGTSTENKVKTRGFDLYIGPGLVFLPSDHWGLRMGIGNISYTHTKTLSGGGKLGSFDISYRTTNLGLSYYF